MAKPHTDGHESEEVISIEVEDPKPRLTTSIREMIREASPLSPECCIYRAPKRFRRFNEKAFDPLVVSIGPFHHGKEELQPMERLKAAYLGAFLTRGEIISLETCIELVTEWENSIRKCYAEPIEFNSNDFVKMILLDSCFVIEVILRFNYVNFLEEVTDHLSHPRIVMDLKDDMILLENQVPFFVLQGLFNLAAFPNSEATDKRFINLCIRYLSIYLLSWDRKRAKRNINRQQPSKVKHLLDLLRICQAPSIPRQNPGITAKSSMWNANKLEEAGMVIKPGLNYSSATDICYTTGVLEIPKLIVDTSSEVVLRNLIALERCLYPDKTYISDYIHFMDFLIDTSKDAELLIRNGIIESFSSDSNEVATLFNNLRPYCTFITYFYYGIQEEVNAYCKVSRHKWRAILIRDYCSSPWMIASTIAAMILLILTFIQTICSIISIS